MGSGHMFHSDIESESNVLGWGWMGLDAVIRTYKAR